MEQWLFSIFSIVSGMIGLGYGSYPPVTWGEALLWVFAMLVSPPLDRKEKKDCTFRHQAAQTTRYKALLAQHCSSLTTLSRQCNSWQVASLSTLSCQCNSWHVAAANDALPAPCLHCAANPMPCDCPKPQCVRLCKLCWAGAAKSCNSVVFVCRCSVSMLYAESMQVILTGNSTVCSRLQLDRVCPITCSLKSHLTTTQSSRTQSRHVYVMHREAVELFADVTNLAGACRLQHACLL